MSSRWYLSIGLLSLAVLFVAGCGSRPSRVPISGKVLIDGKPLERGTISFQPDGGRQSTGDIDKNGNFTLSCFQPGDGAIVGRHKIAVSSTESLNSKDTVIKWFIPRKYFAVETSGLVEQVSKANDSLVINLTWAGSDQIGPFIERLNEDNSAEDTFKKSRERRK